MKEAFNWIYNEENHVITKYENQFANGILAKELFSKFYVEIKF